VLQNDAYYSNVCNVNKGSMHNDGVACRGTTAASKTAGIAIEKKQE